MHLLAKEKGPGWMLLPMAFGVAVMKGPMYFDIIIFNPLLHLTDSNASPPHTEDMRGSRSGLMNSMCAK